MEFHVGDKGFTRDGRQYEVTKIHSGAKLFNVKVDNNTYIYYPNGKLFGHANSETGIDLMLPDDTLIDLHGDGSQIHSMLKLREYNCTDDFIRAAYPNAKRVLPVVQHKGWNVVVADGHVGHIKIGNTEITFTGSIDIKELK